MWAVRARLCSRPSPCGSKPSRILCPVTIFPRLSSGDWLLWEGERVGGGFWESCCGATEAQTLTLSYTCLSGEEAGQPRGTYLAELSMLPTGPTIEYDCKSEIQFCLGVFPKWHLGCLGFILDIGPVDRDTVEEIFCLLIVSCKFRTYFL